MKDKTFVTQPFLPDLEEFNFYLKKIWKNKQITNNGPFHKELEKKICDYLGVKHISLVSNGTIGLLVAIKALKLKGDVLTTPYSFVATTHAIKWNGLNPVFVDVDPISGNISADKIESKITEQTSAILAVHVYGNPCQFRKIELIASKYNLKVIYDAAHAFGVKISGDSILNEGDLSILSFHATKVFNTFEGGAIISKSLKEKNNIDRLINFGFRDEITVDGLGINGKMNEIQASMGILQLKYIDRIIERRRLITKMYKNGLRNIKGLQFFEESSDVKYNYSYLPIFINEYDFGHSRDDLYSYLKNNGIFGRRYFFPLISHFDEYSSLPTSCSKNLLEAEKISNQVICLPIYYDLQDDIIFQIIDLIKNI